jgi:hypothetical protein
MKLLTSFTNFKRALIKFSTDKVGRVLYFGLVNGAYWVKYTVVYGLNVLTCVTFVSIKWLRWAFVNLRKIGSESVCFQKVSDTAYAVDGNNAMHFVHVENNELTCTCPDFQEQVTTFGQGCCKHGYAVLKTLGYSNLREFLKK